MQLSPDNSQPCSPPLPTLRLPACRRPPSLHAALLLLPWSADPIWLACHAQHVRDIVAADAAEEVRLPDGRRNAAAAVAAAPALLQSRVVLVNPFVACCHCCRATTSCSMEVRAVQPRTKPLYVCKGACGNMPVHKARSRHPFHPLHANLSIHSCFSDSITEEWVGADHCYSCLDQERCAGMWGRLAGG